MKNKLKLITIILTVICVILSFTYIFLLMLSGLNPEMTIVEDNFIFTDWFFMIIPLLGFITGILLQIVSLHKKKQKQ